MQIYKNLLNPSQKQQFKFNKLQKGRFQVIVDQQNIKKMRANSPLSTKYKSPNKVKTTSKSPHKQLSPANNKSSKSLSNKKTSPLKQPSHEEVIQKMKKNRQRLCNTLDTYTLLIRSNHPIRCLEHNSTISIYCETEQKLLCSNCIFSKLDHKYHKVVPVDKVFDKITRDIQIMQRQIQRQVEGIQLIYRKIFQHYDQQQKKAHQSILKLQKLYQQARIMIDECEIQSKKKIVRGLQKVQLRNQTILAELNFLKNVYRDQYSQVPPLNDTNFLLYEHVMCNTVINQGKFSNAKLKQINNEIQRIQNEETKKIVSILDSLDSYLRQRTKGK